MGWVWTVPLSFLRSVICGLRALTRAWWVVEKALSWGQRPALGSHWSSTRHFLICERLGTQWPGMLFLTITFKNFNFSDTKKKNARKWKRSPLRVMERLTLFLMKHRGKLLSLSHVRNQGGSDFVLQPLNHMEDPQAHSLNIPELGSHKRTTHHHLWLCKESHSQTTRLCSVFLQWKHALRHPLGLSQNLVPALKVLNHLHAHSPPCAFIHIYFIFTTSWCNRHGKWSFNGEHHSYT